MRLKKIMTAYLGDGTTHTKFFYEDTVKGRPIGIADIGYATAHQADYVTLADVVTGDVVFLKNRTGPTGKPAINVKVDVDASEAKSTIKAILEHLNSPAVAKLAVCQCNISDLLSTGHVAGCPEKR